jgi:uncharacterized protein DUF4190
MTRPDQPSGDDPDSPRGEPEVPFDPYRYGRPDHPIPPEYAPPGYVPDPVAPQPYQHPYGQPRNEPAQHPYGGYYGHAPVPPEQNAYGRPRTGNGKAVASMVLGIASILLFWLTILDAVIIVTSVVLGIVTLAESRNRNGQGKGMAIAGLVCSAIGTAAAVITTVWIVHLAAQCGGIENANQSGFTQCVRDHA